MTLREYLDALNPLLTELNTIRDDVDSALRLKSLNLLGNATNRADVRANIASRVAAASATLAALTLDSDA